MSTDTSRAYLGLVGWLATVLVAAAIGALASVDAPSFYAELERPTWAPPAGVFGPVWTVLYALMGIAAWLVWRAREVLGASAALRLFLVQLVANALWSWLFFAWRLGAWAFVEVVLLWCLVAATLSRLGHVRSGAHVRGLAPQSHAPRLNHGERDARA
jgi:tryptophan-rich sensory protein